MEEIIKKLNELKMELGRKIHTTTDTATNRAMEAAWYILYQAEHLLIDIKENRHTKNK